MSCVKKHVTCVLVAENGSWIVGTNFCRNPQDVCPREPWEGYDKCSTICRQVGHAEEIALMDAGDRAKGARAYILGIGHVCRNCQEKLFAAGVKSFSVVNSLEEIE